MSTVFETEQRIEEATKAREAERPLVYFDHGELIVKVDKRKYRIAFEGETEQVVTIRVKEKA